MLYFAGWLSNQEGKLLVVGKGGGSLNGGRLTSREGLGLINNYAPPIHPLALLVSRSDHPTANYPSSFLPDSRLAVYIHTYIPTNVKANLRSVIFCKHVKGRSFVRVASRENDIGAYSSQAIYLFFLSLFFFISSRLKVSPGIKRVDSLPCLT